MDQLLRTHLLSLEDKLQQLNQQLTSPTTSPLALSHIEAKIQIGQDALESFRRAFELEQQLRLNDSPAKR